MTLLLIIRERNKVQTQGSVFMLDCWKMVFTFSTASGCLCHGGGQWRLVLSSVLTVSVKSQLRAICGYLTAPGLQRWSEQHRQLSLQNPPGEEAGTGRAAEVLKSILFPPLGYLFTSSTQSDKSAGPLISWLHLPGDSPDLWHHKYMIHSLKIAVRVPQIKRK